MMPIHFTTALPTSASGKMESWPTSITMENASGKAEPISHDTAPSRVAYPLRSLQRVGPSSLSFSRRHLNSRHVAELSGTFLVGGSGNARRPRAFPAHSEPPNREHLPGWPTLCEVCKGWAPLLFLFRSVTSTHDA